MLLDFDLALFWGPAFRQLDRYNCIQKCLLHEHSCKNVFSTFKEKSEPNTLQIGGRFVDLQAILLAPSLLLGDELQGGI